MGSTTTTTTASSANLGAGSTLSPNSIGGRRRQTGRRLSSSDLCYVLLSLTCAKRLVLLGQQVSRCAEPCRLVGRSVVWLVLSQTFGKHTCSLCILIL